MPRSYRYLNSSSRLYRGRTGAAHALSCLAGCPCAGQRVPPGRWKQQKSQNGLCYITVPRVMCLKRREGGAANLTSSALSWSRTLLSLLGGALPYRRTQNKCEKRLYLLFETTSKCIICRLGIAPYIDLLQLHVRLALSFLRSYSISEAEKSSCPSLARVTRSPNSCARGVRSLTDMPLGRTPPSEATKKATHKRKRKDPRKLTHNEQGSQYN